MLCGDETVAARGEPHLQCSQIVMVPDQPPHLPPCGRVVDAHLPVKDRCQQPAVAREGDLQHGDATGRVEAADLAASGDVPEPDLVVMSPRSNDGTIG
jgi:hypothetical protein